MSVAVGDWVEKNRYKNYVVDSRLKTFFYSEKQAI